MRIGFGGLLFVLFLALKLTGFIAWSWWWVTAPLWIPVFLVIAVVMIAVSLGVDIKVLLDKSDR